MTMRMALARVRRQACRSDERHSREQAIGDDDAMPAVRRSRPGRDIAVRADGFVVYMLRMPFSSRRRLS